MKILLLHLDPSGRDTLAASLVDDGHDVEAVSDLPEARPKAPPTVVVVCLEEAPQRALDLAARLGDAVGVDAASVLFVGGSKAALAEAQRRFPKASFSRLDALSTALASMGS
jgi:hypothetical protein